MLIVVNTSKVLTFKTLYNFINPVRDVNISAMLHVQNVHTIYAQTVQINRPSQPGNQMAELVKLQCSSPKIHPIIQQPDHWSFKRLIRRHHPAQTGHLSTADQAGIQTDSKMDKFGFKIHTSSGQAQVWSTLRRLHLKVHSFLALLHQFQSFCSVFFFQLQLFFLLSNRSPPLIKPSPRFPHVLIRWFSTGLWSCMHCARRKLFMIIKVIIIHGGDTQGPPDSETFYLVISVVFNTQSTCWSQACCCFRELKLRAHQACFRQWLLYSPPLTHCSVDFFKFLRNWKSGLLAAGRAVWFNFWEVEVLWE